MLAFAAPVVGLAVGSAIAQMARVPLSHSREPFRGVYARAVAMLGFLALMPTTLACYLLAPDWSLMYLASPVTLPSAVVLPALALLLGFSPLVGFFVGYRLGIQGLNAYLRLWMGFLAALIVMLFFLGAQRVFTAGYYEDVYYGSGGQWVTESPVFWPVLLMLGVLTGVFASTLQGVYRQVARETGRELR